MYDATQHASSLGFLRICDLFCFFFSHIHIAAVYGPPLGIPERTTGHHNILSGITNFKFKDFYCDRTLDA
jgi:hypothetical protein